MTALLLTATDLAMGLPAVKEELQAQRLAPLRPRLAMVLQQVRLAHPMAMSGRYYQS